MASSHERQRIVADLETLIVAEEVVSLLCDDYDELPPTEDAENLTSPRNILSLTSATRYLLPRTEVPNSKHFFHNVLPKLDNDRWRQEVRMSKESFRNLQRPPSRIPEQIPTSTNSSRIPARRLPLPSRLRRHTCGQDRATFWNIRRKCGIVL
ncbi:hypothetical protein RvY_03608 [Ramazzottius varieornatus]|uniref:Uncharacterized protein n=1 Tax=Ramazzottius varieornatus TaxID=947166 RepID=A0A1D1UNP3_RAMVA|nr:hypothetical protein RvY_03608 [Ramazzottius varieornatus]